MVVEVSPWNRPEGTVMNGAVVEPAAPPERWRAFPPAGPSTSWAEPGLASTPSRPLPDSSFTVAVTDAAASKS